MTDLALIINCTEEQCFDLKVSCGDLVLGNELQNAIALSLFTNARARAGDTLPNGEASDQQGWWGSKIGSDGEFGSYLWLLKNSNTTQETLNKAKQYAKKSLDWLIDDGIASDVIVEASYDGCSSKQLKIKIEVQQPNNTSQFWRFKYAWDVGNFEVCNA
jgi:phage gp46-like protein